ncbi:hypothetical protein MMP74_10415 [Acinetobacter sp. NIPH 1869]|uniref:hypothetical protein n=1 Tax=Acinetobacter TaxID=469 RepID=UPI0003BE1DDA|nr:MULTISPECIES: hypothetical protein [Acinetobacter]ESK42122.1 hypothetical protein F987_02143 [Acinetobacter gyllenbergii NIPH 230]MCH7304787.1 hypothetical protein [Acinetobacter higginsii]
MPKQYEAVKPIGRFVPGDFVAGLTDSEIQEHLGKGNIKEHVPEPVDPPKTKLSKTEAKTDGN